MTGRRTALVVAVDEYEHPELRRLPSAGADASALAAVLGDPAIGGFDVEVVRNEAAYEIQARIEDLFAAARGDDVLLLHFSGHGLKNDRGELFFAARTTRPDRLASSAVPADFVQRCLAATPSRSVVLLLDCCYGGAFGQGVVVRASGDVNVLDSFPTGRGGGGRGRAVISASNAMEYAFEGEQLVPDSRPRPSPFTGALVRGLATGEADRDEDGWVSLDELYDYVFDQVRAENPKQTPTRDIEMQGELFVARSTRRRIRPVPLPGDLQAALADANPYTRLGAVGELRTRLLGGTEEVAAGARVALEQVVATDTRMVAQAAADALRLPPAPAAPQAQPAALPARAPVTPVTPPAEGRPRARIRSGDVALALTAIAIGVFVAVFDILLAGAVDQPARVLGLAYTGMLVAAGVLLLGGRRLLGYGLLAAGGAAATVNVVGVISGLDADSFPEAGAWPVVLLVVELLTVVVGVLAVAAAARAGGRLSRARLSRPAALVTVAAGVLGSAALAKGAAAVTANVDSSWTWLVAPSWWYPVPALLVPLFGAAVVGAPLRRGVLVGWVVAAAGVHAGFFPTVTSASSTISYTGLVTFLVTLPFVLAAALREEPQPA